MRTVLLTIALFLATAAAEAQVAPRDRLGTRFDNDIRANSESMRRRFSSPTNQIEGQNTRMRERLNSKDAGQRRR
jgi:hypothetical protein